MKILEWKNIPSEITHTFTEFNNTLKMQKTGILNWKESHLGISKHKQPKILKIEIEKTLEPRGPQ